MQKKSKQTAANCAANLVKDGMIVGLGTGSTASFFIEKIGERVAAGLKIKAVSTSSQSSAMADRLGIPQVSIDQVEFIDMTVDGADEVDPFFNGIKGGGGALLFEKIVARCSKTNIWIIDKTKLVERLGRFPVPVEIVPFGYKQTLKKLSALGGEPVIRKINDQLFTTDSGNYIADLHFRKIVDATKMEKELSVIPGVVENGLFINIASMLIIGDGEHCEIRHRN